MFTLSAIADEISPDPRVQIDVLAANRIRHLEFRSIDGVNVLDLPDTRLAEFRSLLAARGILVSAIASPVGKSRIDEPFDAVEAQLRRAIAVAQRFQTQFIRIFSFYPAENEDAAKWPERRQEVVDRIAKMVEIAEADNVCLLHENERGIYGEIPERVSFLLSKFVTKGFAAIFDPGNYVACDCNPWAAWLLTGSRTIHFHIKDWKLGDEVGRLPGQGDGQIPRILANAAARQFHGFLTLEPHLQSGGSAGGTTGPELFPQAVEALRAIVAPLGGAS